ncbi:MAG: tetratricopeptide repeat protein [Proteobacteria bacterium]|nr:tetratricopeptide repeat protein [Pseudomonadota bacterium]
MILFIVLAAALAAACVAVIAVPLLKPVPSRTATAPWAALGAAGVLVIGSAALYPTWSNWSWHKSPGIGSPEGMIERLIHRLNDHPGDVAGWLMLGRSYVVLQEYPLAVRAYTRADHAAGGRSAEALVGEAEAISLMNNSQISGAAGRLIERALAIDPTDPQALFFGAAAAMHRGELPLARARFTKLLALNPPARVKAILEQEISGIDRQLASAHPAPSPKKP